MISKLAFIALICFLLTISSTTLRGDDPVLDRPFPTEFSKDKWREILLALTRVPKARSIVVSPAAVSGSKEEKFISFYREHLETAFLEMEQLGYRISALHELLNSGLEYSAEEKKDWQTQLSQATEIGAQYDTNDKLKEDQLKWGKLAKGLRGDLANFARENAIGTEIGSFSSRESKQVAEVYELDQQILQIASDLPSKDKALALSEEVTELTKSYRSGKIDVKTAADAIKKLYMENGALIGKEFVEKAGPQIKRMSYLRSYLAKSKGYATWADYKLATQAQPYDDKFNSVKKLLSFLRNTLDETTPIAKKLVAYIAKKHGLDINNLDPWVVSLLLPPADDRFLGYFPKEKVEAIWRETMAKAGFKEEVTRRVLIDSFPRAGKQGNAYMMPMRMASPRTTIVNGKTLEFATPTDSRGWTKAIMAIDENFTSDGIENIRVMLHEGGHSLEMSSVRALRPYARAYGYSETHSHTMEHMTEEKQFLLDYGQNSAGEKLTSETIDLYLKERAIGRFFELRSMLKSAIFDLLIWNYDYTQPDAIPFWEYEIKTYQKLSAETEFYPTRPEFVDVIANSMVADDHYYSGDVNTFGYPMAVISSDMVAGFIREKMKASTGRASMYNQPTMAALLAPLYQNGFKKKFPTSVEEFTGKKFSAQDLARSLSEQILKLIEE